MIKDRQLCLTVNTLILYAKKRDFLLRPMRLQKLLYFCFKDYLDDHKEALFEEKFEAWAYGAVLKSVYHEFSEFGYQPIQKFAYPPSEDEVIIFVDESPACLSIKRTLDKYLKKDDLELAEMIQKTGGAWWKARAEGRKEILLEDIKQECRGL